MAAKTRKLDCETAVDRISNLPGNLIDLILQLLPIHVAAQMSILSKTWRDIWLSNPYLVFDSVFFSEVGSKKDKQTRIFEVPSIISSVLLAHSGPVSNFLLCIPLELPFHNCRDMSLWIKNISNNRVRKLELLNKTLVAYKMPSHLFSCSELTHLTLVNCILNPPTRFQGFCNLIYVKLVDVKITADMLFGTRVEKLYLTHCTGVGHLGCQFKYSNNFTDLIILYGGEIDLEWFECMQNVIVCGLMMERVTNFKNETINLDKLLGNMPMTSILFLGGSFLGSLGPCGAVLKRPMPKLTYLILFCVSTVHIQHVLCLIRSSPNLQNLNIRLDTELNSSDDVDLLDWMVLSGDMKLEQLEYIEIQGMVGSRTEFQFVKLLLASAPSLQLIKLVKNRTVDDPNKELRILQELLQFPRVSPTAQIKWIN